MWVSGFRWFIRRSLAGSPAHHFIRIILFDYYFLVGKESCASVTLWYEFCPK